ncbi:hypothetical protein Tco_0742389 [Tanacetum coccineum]
MLTVGRPSYQLASRQKYPSFVLARTHNSFRPLFCNVGKPMATVCSGYSGTVDCLHLFSLPVYLRYNTGVWLALTGSAEIHSTFHRMTHTAICVWSPNFLVVSMSEDDFFRLGMSAATSLVRQTVVNSTPFRPTDLGILSYRRLIFPEVLGRLKLRIRSVKGFLSIACPRWIEIISHGCLDFCLLDLDFQWPFIRPHFSEIFALLAHEKVFALLTTSWFQHQFFVLEEFAPMTYQNVLVLTGPLLPIFQNTPLIRWPSDVGRPDTGDLFFLSLLNTWCLFRLKASGNGTASVAFSRGSVLEQGRCFGF